MTPIDLQALKTNRPHFPVMLREVMQELYLTQHPVILDCTFGFGGYSETILANLPYSTVIAIDRDPLVLDKATQLQQQYGERFQFFHTKFSQYPEILNQLNCTIDNLILDLGFSSMQIQDNKRGFSFKATNEISMEMGLNEIDTVHFINHVNESLLADIIYHYGEDHKARKIARSIIKYRQHTVINTSSQLANIILEVSPKYHKIHPATKTFQALRIYINDELNELELALKHSLNYLNNHGRLITISFHSLEDRIVKNFIKHHNTQQYQKKEKFTFYKGNILHNNQEIFSTLKSVHKKVITPQSDEVKINPPSSSAKLRVAEKIILEP